jgi:hypothetical protein
MSGSGGRTMRRLRLLVLSIVLAAAVPVFGQQRPLKTDDAEILNIGRVRMECGAEFLQGQKYSLSGLEGNLSRLGVSNIHVGMGEYAEFQISGVARDFLSISNQADKPVVPSGVAGNSTNDFGNLVLASKLKLVPEKGSRPAMAFKFAVELPNAKPDSGLGASETEFYASLLFTKHLGPAQLHGNLGFAILGSPVMARRQADPLTYGVAAVIPLHRSVNLVGEISGRQGPGGRVGNENQSQLRTGLQIHNGGVRWDLAGIVGLKPFDPDSGLAIGMTYEFQAFHRNRTPTTIR